MSLLAGEQSGAGGLDRAVAEARAHGSGGLLLAGGRIGGALDFLTGRSDDRHAPSSPTEFRMRGLHLSSSLLEARRALAAAAAGGSSDESGLAIGHDRLLMVLSASAEVEARMTEARAAIEAQWLTRHQGALSIAIDWVRTTDDEVRSPATAAALERRIARREKLPFLDAFGGAAPLGPFVESASGSAATAGASPSSSGPVGVIVVRRPRGQCSDFDTTSLAAEPSLLPGLLPPADGGAKSYAAATAAAALAAGPLAEILGVAALAAEASKSGTSIAIDGARDERGLAGALTRARFVATRGTSFFGSRIAPDRLAEAIALGQALAPLARREGEAMRGLLEVAVALDEGMDVAPLDLISRWRGRAHALAASLGMNERALRSAGDAETPERRALKSLIGEFPRWFDSGAARAPLFLALLDPSTAPEVCSA